MILLPQIIEDSGRGKRAYDLPSKLFESNIIVIEGEISEESMQAAKMQLLYLDKKPQCTEIEIYISSGGGSVYAGNGLIDLIQLIDTPVNTTCTGMIASMGTQIFASGTGTRRLMPRSRVMIHSVGSGASGKYQDLLIEMKETEYLQKQLMRDLSSFTKGKTTYAKMCKLTDRDNWLNSEEAIEIGIADEILETRDQRKENAAIRANAANAAKGDK